MRQDNPTIIASAPGPLGPSAIFWAVTLTALAIGGLALAYYASADLTLSHYDARGHLVVARRIADSLTPGWKQIGAVWLPLPHLVNLLPAQWDWNYQTGLASALLSVIVLAVGLGALAAYLLRETRSPAAAAVGPALLLLNPNVLYLQSTPMTEPMLLGLACLALTATAGWVRAPSLWWRHRAGWALAALVLTRYEGWCVGAALVALAAVAMWREPLRRRFALVPWIVVPILGFFLLSWATTGQWFVTGGFFVPENPALDHPAEALRQVATGARDLAGWPVMGAGLAGVAVVLATRRATVLLSLALLAAAALPFWAFLQGHPFRVRYMVSLAAALAVASAFAVAALPARLRMWAALGVCAAALVARPPLQHDAPMVVEAQWERPYRTARAAVTAYLEQEHDGTPILASMGSLGHYMHETSAIGLRIADFLHEGNGDLWQAGLACPACHVEWILIEERAEGGDDLAMRAAADPGWLAGFARVAEGGGLALYRRIRT